MARYDAPLCERTSGLITVLVFSATAQNNAKLSPFSPRPTPTLSSVPGVPAASVLTLRPTVVLPVVTKHEDETTNGKREQNAEWEPKSANLNNRSDPEADKRTRAQNPTPEEQ
jgi:hypothetical protein